MTIFLFLSSRKILSFRFFDLKEDLPPSKMNGKTGDLAKAGLVGAAVVGTVVYTQYKFGQLDSRVKELEDNQRIMAKYIKLLESRIAALIKSGVPVQNTRPQPRTHFAERKESEESDSEEFSETYEEEEEVRPPSPKPARVIHRPHVVKPRVHKNPSTPRPEMPVARRDFETHEPIQNPPTSSLRREVINNPAPAPKERVIELTADEEEEGLVANPVSMTRGIFDDDLDNDPADTKESKPKRTKDRAASMKAKAEARARAIKERRKG